MRSAAIDNLDIQDITQISYSITDIKALLRDYIRQAVLNSRQDEAYDHYIFTDHYEPADAYLVLWDNRIAEIKFYWTPTTEQIEKAAEILMPP